MKLLLPILIFTTYFSCASQEKSVNERIYQINAIKDTFKEISSANLAPASLEKKFFEVFPSSFQDFKSLYDIQGPLYEFGYDHLMTLYTLKSIPNERKISKYILLGVNGIWEGDNTADLQWQTFNLMTDQPIVAARILETMSETEQRSVFYFLLDGPHPNDAEKARNYASLKSLFISIDENLGKFIEEEYKKVIINRTN